MLMPLEKGISWATGVRSLGGHGSRPSTGLVDSGLRIAKVRVQVPNEGQMTPMASAQLHGVSGASRRNAGARAWQVFQLTTDDV
jgi:hypothetical protein